MTGLGTSPSARVLAGLALAVAVVACGPPSFRQGQVPHGELRSLDGVWMMRLWGTPAQRGEAAAALVGEQIRWALPRYLRATVGSDTPRGRLLEVVRTTAAGIPQSHREQLEALAAHAALPLDTLLAVNLAPELFGSMACTCLAVAGDGDASGRVLLARNLDWYGGDLLAELGLVVVESGSGRSFASVTWPGLVGVVTGINDEGLTVANLVVLGQRARATSGVPVLFAQRRLLEQADSVDAAAALLSRTPRTVPQNYALADPHTAAVVETWRRRFRRRDLTAGALGVANLFDEDRRTRPGSRYARMMAAASGRELGAAELQEVLADVALGDMNVQAVVIDPAARLVHGSTRSRPAARGPYWILPLREWLE